jgi:hypothetical protein
MYARQGRPVGARGTITFDTSAYAAEKTAAAVRDEHGNYWVQARPQSALWLPANVRADQFSQDCAESKHSWCGTHDAAWAPFADTCTGA